MRGGLPQFIPTTEQVVTAATVARDQECGRVGENCRRRVAELATALRYKALTDRAAEIDVEIATLTDKLVSLPTVTSADPQIDAAVAVIAWLSRGSFAPAASAIEMPRLLGVAAMPILGGLLIAFAMGLAPAQRDKHGASGCAAPRTRRHGGWRRLTSAWQP